MGSECGKRKHEKTVIWNRFLGMELVQYWEHISSVTANAVSPSPKGKVVNLSTGRTPPSPIGDSMELW